MSGFGRLLPIHPAVFANRNQVVLFVLGTVLIIGICLDMDSWWPLLLLPVCLGIRLYYAKKGMVSD